MKRFDHHCPFCGVFHTATSDVDAERGAQHVPGDWSICWKCGEIGIFTSTGVRKLTAQERLEASRDEEVQAARAAWLVRTP